MFSCAGHFRTARSIRRAAEDGFAGVLGTATKLWNGGGHGQNNLKP